MFYTEMIQLVKLRGCFAASCSCTMYIPLDTLGCSGLFPLYTPGIWAFLLVIQCQIICLNKVSQCCTYIRFMWGSIDSDIWGLVDLWRATAGAGVGRWEVSHITESVLYLLLPSSILFIPGKHTRGMLENLPSKDFFNMYLKLSTSKWVYQL